MKFGLICEGITDHRVIENLLCGFFPEYPDLDEDINFLQPTLDETDSQQQGFGGWELVIAYLKSSQFEQAVINHDYIVIQIDTDCCEHPNFGVHPISLAAQDQADFYEKIRNKLIEFICHNTIYAHYADKILFCICIHSLECWLIALYESRRSKSPKINNCEDAFGKLLMRQNYREKFEKTSRCYDKISQLLLKAKTINGLAGSSYSLDRFLEQLAYVAQQPCPDPPTGLIDAEAARLRKELDKLEKEVGRLAGKLENPAFVDKAPADVVAKEQEKLAAVKTEIATLQEQLVKVEAL